MLCYFIPVKTVADVVAAGNVVNPSIEVLVAGDAVNLYIEVVVAGDGVDRYIEVIVVDLFCRSICCRFICCRYFVDPYIEVNVVFAGDKSAVKNEYTSTLSISSNWQKSDLCKIKLAQQHYSLSATITILLLSYKTY